MLLKKNILILVEEKQNNLNQSFCHITLCSILEKNFALCTTKKIILTLVLSEKKFWTKQKTITPPFKLNGPSLTKPRLINLNGVIFLQVYSLLQCLNS
jgi:hypothetical protein